MAKANACGQGYAIEAGQGTYAGAGGMDMTQGRRMSAVGSALLVLKPGIAVGVSLAGYAGMTLATGGLPEAYSALLTVGCILLAAMGSAAINVVAESGSDLRMGRLAARNAALANLGRVLALAISITLVAVSLVLSYLYINPVAATLILAASLSYTVMYTLYFKRRSPFGVVMGGLPGALPVLIGYCAVRPGAGFDGALLFLLILLWQPPHFLSLALKYDADYRAAGLPAMPGVMGADYTRTFILIYATALVPLVGAMHFFGPLSGLSALAGAAVTLAYIALTAYDIYSTGRYGRAFALSILYIMVMLTGVVADLA